MGKNRPTVSIAPQSRRTAAGDRAIVVEDRGFMISCSRRHSATAVSPLIRPSTSEKCSEPTLTRKSPSGKQQPQPS
jgi:hypothetical protein